MQYIGYFADLDGKNYKVEITPNRPNKGSATIKLGGTPIVTKLEGGDDTIYKPIRYSGATVQIVKTDFMFDVYSVGATDTSIVLSDEDDRVVWTGFVTPNLYNQGYQYDLESFEIEAIDGLSALKYIPYKSNREIKSIKDIICNILKQLKCYSFLYVPQNLTVDSKFVFDSLFISENNFYSKKEKDQTDDDVAWKCNEVLEEICKYLNVTMAAVNDSVYLIDYDYLRNADETYYTGWDISTGNLYDTNLDNGGLINIDGDSYSGSNNTISLDNVYNKITIKADLNTFSDFMPNLFSECNNITKDDRGLVYKDPKNRTDETTGEVYPLGYTRIGTRGGCMSGQEKTFEKDGEPLNWMANYYDLTVDSEQSKSAYKYAQKWNKGTGSIVFSRFYSPKPNSILKVHAYKNDTEIDYPTELNLWELVGMYDKKNFYCEKIGMNGGWLAKLDVTEINKEPAAFVIDDINSGTGTHESRVRAIFDRIARDNNKTTVSLKDCIIITNPASNRGSDYSKPVFELNTVERNAFFGGKNAYIVIKGQVNMHYFDQYPYNITGVDINDGRTKFDKNNRILTCKLQIGDKYWDGEEWTTTDTTFEMPLGEVLEKQKKVRLDEYYLKNNNTKNTVEWWMGLNESGYAVKVPYDILTGTPKFTIYRVSPLFTVTPTGLTSFDALPSVTTLYDFKFKCVIGDPTYSDSKEDDTKYTTIINDQSIKDLSDIDMKVNTYDDKEMNYSAVALKNPDGSYKYLDKVNVTGITGVSEGMRLEEYLIQRIYNQYHSPSKILEIDLHNDSIDAITVFDHKFGRFIIDSYETDWRMKSTHVKLIEKK